MANESNALETQRRVLEDAFFLKHDQMLIEKHRALKQMEQSKHALSEVSGISDDGTLQKFVELGIGPHTLASLAVVPLVAVAWADGRVDEKEREAVIRSGAPEGFARGSIDAELLQQWLSHRPGPELMVAWTSYVEGVCECLSPHERESLRAGLLERARAVAAATGGFLGITSGVSAAEQAVLGQIERAFRA
ncbi:MAG: hypothetical protein IMZ67_00385 [Acidobacteria bacterium]|nr:hypothetical protein [Acidobacteriota bacterium]